MTLKGLWQEKNISEEGETSLEGAWSEKGETGRNKLR